MGWMAPFIIRGKILLQAVWTAGLDWDDPLPENLEVKLREFLDELKMAPSFTLPRWIGTLSSSSLEIHGFSDASQETLGAVIYLCLVTEDFHGFTSLLMAKTKVAPQNQVTIARLELSAAVLLVVLVDRVRNCSSCGTVPLHL